MPIATGALYVRRFSDKKAHDFSINVTMEIHNQFIETLKQAEWMDPYSRDASIRKAKAMKFIFGYPVELANETLINEYYKDLDFNKTDLFLHTVLRITKFQKNHEIAELQMPAKIDDWTNFAMATDDLADVGTLYFLRQNSLRMLFNFILIFVQIFCAIFKLVP